VALRTDFACELGVQADVLGLFELKAHFAVLEEPGQPYWDEAWLNTLAGEVGQAICNYCNIDCVPTALARTWAAMMFDYWFYWVTVHEGSSSSTSESIPAGIYLRSVTEGQTTVSYSESSSNTTTISAGRSAPTEAMDAIILNYVDALNKFRRMTW